MLLLGGSALRWTAPVLVGWVGGAALVLRELAPYAEQTPQWVLIGAAGIVLLGVGHHLGGAAARPAPGGRLPRPAALTHCADRLAGCCHGSRSSRVGARSRLVVPDGGPVRAPYVATSARGAAELTLASGAVTLTATYDDRVALHVTTDGRTTTHRSRRSGRPEAPVEAVALTLTGPQVTAFTQRGRGLGGAGALRPHRPARRPRRGLAGRADRVGRRDGPFGQLGLRDLRVVSHADGSPYVRDGRVLLTATSAGPGGFPTGHCSVWSLDPDTLELEHRADLFLRRGGGVYGDHAAHLLRDGDRWLLAASTWGDFDRHQRPVSVTLAESTADLTRGVHVARRPAAGAADRGLPVGRRLGPAPGADRRRLAGGLRERDEVLPLPPRPGRRPRRSTR